MKILLTALVVATMCVILCGSCSVTFSLPSSFSISKSNRGTKRTYSSVIPITVHQNKIRGKIAVGSPKEGEAEQMLNIRFDIHSSLTWLYSVDLCEGRNCERESFTGFDGLKSTTYQKGKQISLNTADGGITAWLSTDQFKFGLDDGAAVANLQFFEITQKNFENDGFDGRLGLDLREDGVPNQQLSVLGLLEQFKEPAFGIYLQRTENREFGNLIVGQGDAGFREGPLNSHDVLLTDNKPNGWNIKIDKVVLIYYDGERKERELRVQVAAPSPAVEGISLHTDDYDSVLAMLFEKFPPGATTTSLFKCSDDWSNYLPKLVLVMDGHEYVMTPEDYVDPPTDVYCGTLLKGTKDVVQLGRTFMRKFFTRFNIGAKQVQFAKAKPLH